MAPPVILVPGLAADGAMWTAQRDALAGTREVHVTDVHFRRDTLPDMARALLDEHRGELLLCGASMGGMIAFEALRQAPERVRGVALLGTSAEPESPPVAALRAQALALIEDGLFDEVIVGNVPFSFHPERLDDAMLVDTYLDMLRRAGAGGLVRQNRAVAVRADSRPLLLAIACPVLVLCGDSDRVTTLAASREIADAVPGAAFEVIPRCGHMLTMERPAEVNAALQRWLDRHFPLPG